MKFTLLTFFFHCVYGMSSEPKFTLKKKKRYTFIPTLVPVVEKTILLLLNCVGTFVENHLEKKKKKKIIWPYMYEIILDFPFHSIFFLANTTLAS